MTINDVNSCCDILKKRKQKEGCKKERERGENFSLLREKKILKNSDCISHSLEADNNDAAIIRKVKRNPTVM